MEQSNRVLIIDDSEANSYFMARILRQSGYDAFEVSNGTDGLRLAHENPSLIILDVNLPDIDGFTIAQTLKSDPATMDIPIIQTSAWFTQDAHQVEGLERGADAYLIQPVNPDILISTVKAMLRLRAAERFVRIQKAAEFERDLFFERSHEVLTVMDQDGYFIRVNEAFHQVIGRFEADLSSLSFAELCGSEDFQQSLSRLRSNLESNCELKIKKSDGSSIPMRWRFVPAVEERRIYGFGKDLSDEQQTFSRYLSLLKHTPIGIAFMDHLGRFKDVSTTYSRITGYTADELISAGFPDITHPLDLRVSRQVFHDFMRSSDKRLSAVKRIVRKNGDVVQVRTLFCKVRAQGSPEVLSFIQVTNSPK